MTKKDQLYSDLLEISKGDLSSLSRAADAQLKPAKARFTLAALLAGVTEDNVHAEALTDKPRGRELI